MTTFPAGRPVPRHVQPGATGAADDRVQGSSDPVTEAIANLMGDARTKAATLGDEYAALWEEIGRAVRGGKHFRAQLVVRTHAGLGGVRDEAAAQVAAAFELMHAGFLVHDDLIDHDTMRRGEPNLAAAMYQRAAARGSHARAERFAAASALLAGDLLLGMAHHAFATVDVPRPVHLRLQAVLAETLLVSVAGELDDVAYELRTVPMERAMKVAEAKTAMYSFQAPFRAAAILADADPSAVRALDALGRDLGIAFQLADDLLGTFAPEDVIGKSNISDLREGKCTTLMLHARSMPVWREIREHVGRPDLDEATAADLRGALAACEAPREVRAQAQRRLDAVVRSVRAESLPAPVGDFVVEIARMITAMLADAWRHVLHARPGERPRVGG